MTYTMRFELLRNHDADVVADGVFWPDDSVTLRWRGENRSTAVYADWGAAMRIHHIGEPKSDRWTTARWLDGVCFCCGSTVGENAMMAGNGAQCARCSASWDGPPSRVAEPEKGHWNAIELPARGEPQ